MVSFGNWDVTVAVSQGSGLISTTDSKANVTGDVRLQLYAASVCPHFIFEHQTIPLVSIDCPVTTYIYIYIYKGYWCLTSLPQIIGNNASFPKLKKEL